MAAMLASRARDPRSTRDQILDAAERAFAERGFSGVSMREIAAEVGLRNQASLYHHFRDKHALYEAVLARGVEAIVALVVAGEPAAADRARRARRQRSRRPHRHAAAASALRPGHPRAHHDPRRMGPRGAALRRRGPLPPDLRLLRQRIVVPGGGRRRSAHAGGRRPAAPVREDGAPPPPRRAGDSAGGPRRTPGALTPCVRPCRSRSPTSI